MSQDESRTIDGNEGQSAYFLTWLRKIRFWSLVGFLSWIGSILLAGRLIWEQTILSWAKGPQMIGFSLSHGSYGLLLLAPFVLLFWFVATLTLTLIKLIKKKPVSSNKWLSIFLTFITLATFYPSYGFWQYLFAERIANGPHAAEFLSYAATSNDFRTVREILRYGVPINTSDPKDKNTALHSAAIGGDVEIVGYLIDKGADVNATNRLGDSPLENAYSMHNDFVAQLLIKHGALQIRGAETQRDSVTTNKVRDLIEEMVRPK